MIDIKEAAKHHWPHVLSQLDIPESSLTRPNRPCPLCGGTDRFSLTDLNGSGSWFCRGCGHGDGFDLLMKRHSWDFKQAAKEVERVLGVPGLAASRSAKPILERTVFRPKTDPAKALNNVYRSSCKVRQGDQVHRYLQARGLSQLPPCLRYHKGLRVEGKVYPAMIAILQDVTGRYVSLHRTFLHGDQKAPVSAPKKLMTPTTTVTGAAIRLWPATDTVGLCEGIETGAAVSELFGVPTWACVSAHGLSTVKLPDSIRNVLIFGDEDSTSEFAGQLAAFTAAARLAKEGRSVQVKIPAVPNSDWLSELLLRQGRPAA